MKEALIIAGLFIAFVLIFTAVLSLPFMFLWNWIMPDIFGLTKITFWQAIGLLLLSNILFKSNSNQKKA